MLQNDKLEKKKNVAKRRLCIYERIYFRTCTILYIRTKCNVNAFVYLFSVALECVWVCVSLRLLFVFAWAHVRNVWIGFFFLSLLVDIFLLISVLSTIFFCFASFKSWLLNIYFMGAYKSQRDDIFHKIRWWKNFLIHCMHTMHSFSKLILKSWFVVLLCCCFSFLLAMMKENKNNDTKEINWHRQSISQSNIQMCTYIWNYTLHFDKVLNDKGRLERNVFYRFLRKEKKLFCFSILVAYHHFDICRQNFNNIRFNTWLYPNNIWPILEYKCAFLIFLL